MLPIIDNDILLVTEDNNGIDNFDQLSLFSFERVTNITFFDCFASDNNFARNGSFLQITMYSQVKLIRTQISRMNSLKGGALFVFYVSEIIMVDSTFTQMLAKDAGVMIVSEYSSVQMISSRFENNKAIYNAVFKITEDSSVLIDSSIFENNKAWLVNSIGQLSQISNRGVINHSIFANNLVLAIEDFDNQQGGGLEINRCHTVIKIYNSKFNENFSTRGPGCVCIVASTGVKIDNSTFFSSFNVTKFISTSTEMLGGFINIQPSSIVNITNCTFRGGIADFGGAIYSIGTNSLFIDSSYFYNNTARFDGGGIYALNYRLIVLRMGCKFERNFALLPNKGDALSLKGRQREFTLLQDIEFSSNFTSCYIFADSISVLIIANSKFVSTNTTRNSSLFTNGGVFIRNTLSIAIQDSSFENLFGQYDSGGSALIVEQTTKKGQLLQQPTLEVFRNNFTNCFSQTNGGAITLINYEYAWLRYNTFTSNTALKAGGAIFYSCTTNYLCVMEITNCTFKHNYANIEGGAIKWTKSEPQFSDDVIFINNTAGIYGDDLASVARVLVRITDQELGKKFYNESGTIIVSQDQFIPEFQSGQSINLYFGVIDKYGTYVSTDNGSKLNIMQYYLQQLFSVVNQAKNPQFASVIESHTEISSSHGFYRISPLSLVCEPNSSQVLTFSSFAIDHTIDDNAVIANRKSPLKSQYIQQTVIAQTSSSFQIALKVQSCQLGHKLLSNGKCQLCSKSTYLFDTQTEPTSCKECQSQFSECPGGNLVYPLPGYWRSSNISELFYACLYPEACLGRNNQTETFIGQCAEGYQGILCADCAQKYSKNPSLSRCSKCPEQDLNILILACMLAAFVVLITVLVNSNRVNSKNEKNYLPVFFRILVNHLQILYLTASFELDWPEEILNFYKSVQPISDAQSQLFSIDCFLTQSTLSQYFNDVRPVVIKSVLIMIFPIALIILSLASQSFWKRYADRIVTTRTIQIIGDEEETKTEQQAVLDEQITSKNQNCDVLIQSTTDSSKIQGKGSNFISTLIVILFLIHPTITREMFALFKQEFQFQFYLVVRKLMECQDCILILRLFATRVIICSYQSGQHHLH
ncbi:hypothetical protein FGO68_gene10378 [Halteria grandinella]|uniref:Transmembrane protein n=1 Tax=Halteria grandinella TaxID=5974 RepID=A0A8J8TAX4_HALGN|nr:hypothetical protein FGO68_gene10378 [Halteria grandinella]